MGQPGSTDRGRVELTPAHACRRMGEISESGSFERMQLARLETLDELLTTLAGVLDVFTRVSAIAARVIPHDMISLPLLTEDKNSIVIYAIAGNPIQFPETVPLPEHHRRLVTSPWDHLIQPDIQADPLERLTPPGRAGYRARLLVPVRVQGEMLGVIDFLSLQPDVYTTADVLIARRIADHVALALSHYRLAEQARRNEELRTNEARLELLDARLATVADSRELTNVFDRISEIARKVLAHDALVLPVMLEDGTHARADAYSALGAVERATIEHALQESRFNKSKAAKQLGLSRKQLYARLRQHGLG